MAHSVEIHNIILLPLSELSSAACSQFRLLPTYSPCNVVRAEGRLPKSISTYHTAESPHRPTPQYSTPPTLIPTRTIIPNTSPLLFVPIYLTIFPFSFVPFFLLNWSWVAAARSACKCEPAIELQRWRGGNDRRRRVPLFFLPLSLYTLCKRASALIGIASLLLAFALRK